MKQIRLKIDQFLLDYENRRTGTTQNQREALQAILDDPRAKLFNLAQSIVTDGVSPIEIIMVVREKPGSNSFITLEGNRRIAALKILQNPHVLGGMTIKSALPLSIPLTLLIQAFPLALLFAVAIRISAMRTASRNISHLIDDGMIFDDGVLYVFGWTIDLRRDLRKQMNSVIWLAILIAGPYVAWFYVTATASTLRETRFPLVTHEMASVDYVLLALFICLEMCFVVFGYVPAMRLLAKHLDTETTHSN